MVMHLLWSLHFMNVYLKQDDGSAAAGDSSGSIDVKSWTKHLWPFAYNIALLEQHVVRCNTLYCCCYPL